MSEEVTTEVFFCGQCQGYHPKYVAVLHMHYGLKAVDTRELEEAGVTARVVGTDQADPRLLAKEREMMEQGE